MSFEREVVIASCVVFGRVMGYDKYVSFAGHCRHKGESMSLSAATTTDDFISLFGEPYWRDDDKEETILFYEFDNDLEWQAEFDSNGQLKLFLIVTPPLMADPKQHKAYGVYRPWPP